MKRPIFTQYPFLNLVSRIFKTTNVACSIALTLIIFQTNVHAQVDCNVIMACNDGVQISLDEDCNMFIEPSMILEAQAYHDTMYNVEAKLANGTIIPFANVGSVMNPTLRPIINNTHRGLTILVKVSLKGCGNSCWGEAKIEDKLKPEILSCPCEQRITSFTGTIPGNSLTYQRPLASQCVDMMGGFQTSDYIVFQFAVDVTGIVDINLGNINQIFNLYQNSFDRLNPCTNRISLNTRSYSASLTAGINYFIVVAVDDSPNSVPVNTLSIDHRTGNIKSSAAASSTICTLTCNGEVALLAQTANNAQSRPVFSDACSLSNLTYAKLDRVEVLQCADRYSKIVRRDWTATDQSGNVSDTKTQYFYINRANLADVICPADWIRSCSLPFAKLPNGAPTPAVSGQPSNVGCHNIQVYYNDVVFELCGAGIKVFRQWNIIDWCTGQDKICAQTIKVEDDVRPVVTCPADITAGGGNPAPAAIVSTSDNSCTANWAVLPPISVFDCSKVTWEVFFKKADSNGNPPLNTPFTKIDGNTRVVGSLPAFASTISASARPYTIENLPLGRTWLQYIVTDECGNTGECRTEIDVVDKTPPTAICEGTTVVTLGDTGWAELFATSLDDHSHDNCKILKFEVRRKLTHCVGYASDLNFKDRVNFCCADVTTPESTIAVILRVYDEAGNFNDCETTVKVQNKRKPVITCPGDKTLSCGDSKIAAFASTTSTSFDAFFGQATVTGVCGNLTVSSRVISNSLNACGSGQVIREWFVVNDPTVTCLQRLNVSVPIFTINNIQFPGDREINSCNLGDATPDVLNSKPIVNASGCSQIGISSTDQLFYETPEACIKILRTWRVIDWCTYNSNSGPIFEKTQVIKLKGTNAPSFTTACSTLNVDTDPTRCDKEVVFTANAKDDCTADADLKYKWTLDLGKNGSIDFNGTGKTFTRVLEVGTHRVSFTVTNRCGASSTCAYDVIVKSTKKPTPVCLKEVVWVIDADGSSEIWASDFDLKSTGACGSTAGLKFSFNAAGTQPARTFTCADIPNGQVARIPLNMYVIDASGNSDFCSVTLILQDSPLTNACTDNAGLLPTVSGKISTEMQEGIDNIEVALVNMNSSTEIKDKTKNQGKYKLSGVDVFDPKSIGAYKNTDILNGVSTLDLVLIQRHILGIQKIESPYKLLAADVNNSRSITASDLVNLRKLVLGVTLEFENNTSWRFMPADYKFEDPAFPFDFPSKVNLDSLFEDKSNVNFLAIKIGDVNNSVLANANSIQTEKRAQEALFTSDEKSFESGEEFRYVVKAGSDLEIMGTQFGFEFDPSTLAFDKIESGKFDLKSQHINAAGADKGQLIFSFDASNGLNITEDANLFTIVFKAVRSGNASEIKLSETLIRPEIYEMDASVRKINLQTRVKGVNGAQNVLYQNEPNPFKENTRISFELAKSSNATLRVLDMTGKLVYSSTNKYDKGYHVINIDGTRLSKSGVYYYQIEAGEFVSTKKMILIE